MYHPIAIGFEVFTQRHIRSKDAKKTLRLIFFAPWREIKQGNFETDALLNFEIIGEAANRIPIDFKSDHPEIEWRRIVGFRNRIIHEYFGINYEIVWTIKEENIPELAEFVQLALDDL